MTDLSVPDLDDLRFQDLVDAAKRYLPQRVPAWTDHNVSDPGITLIEACATRVDHLGYRTDQVPDPVRAALLRLAGVIPNPPASAHADLTFTLAAAAGADQTIGAGTEVGTGPGGTGPGAARPAVTFRTLADLTIAAGATSGTVAAVNVVTVHEDLGAATGRPGLRLAPSRVPLTTDQPDGTSLAELTVTVVNPDQSSSVWKQVSTFADVTGSVPCYLWDATAREVVFGTRTPYASGAVVQGDVPVAGARVVVDYKTSQGVLGNIPAGSALTLSGTGTAAGTSTTTSTFTGTVSVAKAATGGAQAETVPDAMARTVADLAPLRRAVTAEDFAQLLTRQVPGVARILTASVPAPVPVPAPAAGRADTSDPGLLQVTVVPKPAGNPRAVLADTDLHLSAAMAKAIGDRTESLRLLGTRVRVAEPDWMKFSVTATVRSWASGDSPAALKGRQGAAEALFAYFHPTAGGPDGTGWPFGRPIHAGDAYGVLASLPETIDVVELTVTDAAGYATTRLAPSPSGLPALQAANVSFVTSDQDKYDRVPQGMWGLFDAPDGRGKLLALFSDNAAGLDSGIGAGAMSLVNATATTLRAFSQPTNNMVTKTVYPATTANLVFGTNQKLTSVTVYPTVPDGAFGLYEHAGRTGKQWIFWAADAPVDLSDVGIGAGKSVSSVLNRTTRTLDVRQNDPQAGPGQLFQPGADLFGDVSVVLDNSLRYVTLLNGPRSGQYCLYGDAAFGGKQWVFDASVPDLSGYLTAPDTVGSVANKTPNSVALFAQSPYMSGSAGIQPVPPATTAAVRGPLAGTVASVQYRPEGSVSAWGSATSPLSDIPSGLTDVFAVSAGTNHSLALKSDGSVVAWGADDYGQSSVPAGLTAVAVEAGARHSLALAADGTVAAWGCNDDAQVTVPAGGLTATAVAAGSRHSLALRTDGTVVAWGAATSPGAPNAVPTGLSGVTAIAAGDSHSLALKSDGSVVAWGANDSGQTAVPAGLIAIAVAAGTAHSVALKADGTVVAWGANDSGQTTVPAALIGPAAGGTPAFAPAVGVAAGSARSAVLTADGTVVVWGGDTGPGAPFAVPPATNGRSVAVALGPAQSLSVSVTN